VNSKLLFNTLNTIEQKHITRFENDQTPVVYAYDLDAPKGIPN
jgi:hypothetical protein